MKLFKIPNVENIVTIINCAKEMRKLIQEKHIENINNISERIKKHSNRPSLGSLETKNRDSLNSCSSIGTELSQYSSKAHKIKKEIRKLEEIYLKYKDKLNLKDSREMLLIIFKLKKM